MFPFASAAAYGLGKSGWVNTKLDHGIAPPPEMEDCAAAIRVASLVPLLTIKK